MDETIKKVFEHCQEIHSDFAVKRLTSGHINKTYLVTNGGKKFILQKVNTNVFKNLTDVMQNIKAVSEHLIKKEYPHEILNPIDFNNGRTLYDKHWRLFPFFKETQTFEQAESTEQVFEAAKFISEFYDYLQDLEVDKIKDSIPGFIDFEQRYKNFKLSLKNASKERLDKAADQIRAITDQVDILNNWRSLLPKFPNRVIHADPKISNFLFDSEAKNEIKALIDWDTFMQGPILYDFGDMVRSYTNLKAEDDPELKGPNFSKDNYKALKDGFLYHLKDGLEPVELDNLGLAGRIVIYIQAIRFLTDYLNDDVYYAVHHKEQNLERTKNQLNLLKGLRAYQKA